MIATLRVLGAALVLAGSTALAQAPAPPAFACPSEAEVRAAIEKWHVAYYKDAFRIRSVGDFRFGPATIGAPMRTNVDLGGEVDACPTRITYSYVLTATNGNQSTTTFGDGQIHWFYRNPFGEWAYRTARG